MGSTLLKKSLTDLTRRKARAVFAVLTLAIAVASVGIFAVSPLMDQAMQGEVRASRLADLTLQTKPLVVTPAQLAELRRLPNVDGRAGAQRRPDARLDRRAAAEGDRRRHPELRAPAGRSRHDHVRDGAGRGDRPHGRPEREGGRFDGAIGDTVRVVGVGDRTHTLRVSGVGRNLEWSQTRASTATSSSSTRRPRRRRSSRASRATACWPSGSPTRRTAAANRTADDVREYLRANTSFTRLLRPPEHPRAGHVPGQGAVRAARLADERVHGARAARGGRAGREHDGDADRRAAPGDRDDEGDRRDAPTDPPRLPAHRAACSEQSAPCSASASES